MTLDTGKLNDFMGKFVTEVGALLHGPTVIIGDKLGLYKAMGDSRPITAKSLAAKTNTAERNVREWLNAQAASGYITYDAGQDTYTLPPEQAFALADADSPAYIPGAFYIAASMARDVDKLTDAFRHGHGLGWHEHNGDLFCGTELFFRPGYLANLVNEWLPALDGVVAKLERGATVADIGCGHGASTIVMAKAFPNSTFIGYDYHLSSVEVARAAAQRAGVTDNIRFDTASADGFPGTDYDLITAFDCLHDMGNPQGVAAYVRRALKPDGTWMIVEPYANERIEENLNPVGRIFYSASTMICTPSAMSQPGGLALGAQVAGNRWEEIITQNGFSRFRLAATNAFNRVFEARP